MDHLEPEPIASEPQQPSPPSGDRAPLRLAPFGWAGFVAKDFSLALSTGTLATGVAIVLIDPANWPHWLVFAVPISGLSLALAISSLLFAFTRVWKTVREEHETSALWGELVEEVSPRGTGMENVKDAVFEIPYLFSILVLPFAVVCFQALAACLVLFYICDNYYNLALVRNIGSEESVRLPGWLGRFVAGGHRIRRSAGGLIHSLPGGWRLSLEPAIALASAALATACSVVDPADGTLDRAVLMRFFGRRARLDTLAIWLLLAALFGVTILAAGGARDWALSVALATMLALLGLEIVVEPFRALGVQYQAAAGGDSEPHRELLLWTVPSGARVDQETRTQLTRLHEASFSPAERQYSADFLFQHAGRAGYQLLVLTERAEDAGPPTIAGYVFLEARPEHEVAFLWYLAIDPAKRGHGLGRWMVPLAIEVVHDRWPSLRAVFLETAHPFPNEPEAALPDDLRRVRFYGRLGFSWVRGLDYQIPAEGDRERSLRYDPMFHLLSGKASAADVEFVKASVLEMARDNFPAEAPRLTKGKAADDPRWQQLVASLDRMSLVDPIRASVAAGKNW